MISFAMQWLSPNRWCPSQSALAIQSLGHVTSSIYGSRSYKVVCYRQSTRSREVTMCDEYIRKVFLDSLKPLDQERDCKFRHNNIFIASFSVCM